MPDPKTTAAPKPARKPRATWTHVEVANLLTDFHHGGLENVEKRADPLNSDRYGLHDAESAKAKLIELGLVAKPEKPVLDASLANGVDKWVTIVGEFIEPQRTLAARYAIAKLRELLSKRERNGAT